ncbi:DeoR/GlpR family DNA-binding transcription regulator [Brevundimonas sp. SL130]|uniref:DeoR/GlpR family DNA-binding transcription regulator n=1 Tax=Brevundimonas sp. SL130 TaxID=2995143 RepID=UPI00226D3ECC|nr:DeoR/GlpR family DNA-binding transcription regulator [Brevundimonas sp. SL130]WAC61246.1 DeoR/GlpR family DNA-binding transcription regulator [Brevundimonas sp. SL130]
MSQTAAKDSKHLSQGARLAEILQLLEEKVFWTVSELAERFDVSEETIRRDARQLERSGVVQKVHGGLSSTNNLIEAPYRIRLRENAEAKQKIAQKAASLVTEGMTLLLDSGTTCHWLARALASVRNLTIVTNSVEIAHEVLGHPGQRLLLAGGQVNPVHNAAFGPESKAFCRRFAPDLTILSMGAVDPERGFLDFDADEASFKQSLLEPARRVVVLADHTKLAKSGFIQVAAFRDVQDLVTDLPPSNALARAAAQWDTRLHVADPA